MASNILVQLLTERELYMSLFDAADDMLYDPGVKTYTEGYLSPEVAHRKRLRKVFLALAEAPVPKIEDVKQLKALSAEELKALLDEALEELSNAK